MLPNPRLTGFLLFLLSPVHGASFNPVFPEDGSIPMAAWFTNTEHRSEAVDFEALKTALKKENVALRDISADYEWVQDMTLFTEDGSLLLQALMPPEKEIIGNLTLGILNETDGEPDPHVLMHWDAKERNLKYRQMKWTFVEGGEMITGRFKNDETYAIIDGDVVERTKNFFYYMMEAELSEKAVERLIAKDLGISPEDLFVLDTGGEHLDLFITALPGGVLLLQDPSLTVRAIETILEREIPPQEKRRLERIRDLYAGKYFRTDYIASLIEPVNTSKTKTLLPFKPEWPEQLDAIAGILKSRFMVVRAAGVFSELAADASAAVEEDVEILEKINFFNGFIGSNKEKQIFSVTNGARGLDSLEDYWRLTLARQGIAPEHVYFPGLFSDGAGIDCAGAPSGSRTLKDLQ